MEIPACRGSNKRSALVMAYNLSSTFYNYLLLCSMYCVRTQSFGKELYSGYYCFGSRFIKE